MEIISAQRIAIAGIDKTSTTDVFLVHVRISDIPEYARKMIDDIRDISWISKLDVVDQASFQARSERTIRKLADDIFAKVEDSITVEFGEYLISISARDCLVDRYSHSGVPIAEILKEKVIGNPGFDFHTESASSILVFGEAKYSGKRNPYAAAINQIIEFIRDKKDEAELRILRSFASETAIANALKKKRGYVAAFSVNGAYATIFRNLLSCAGLKQLLEHEELYLIGIEVDAS